MPTQVRPAFIEKPSRTDAEKFPLEGSTIWNAGIFLSWASVLLDALRLHAPDVLEVAKVSMQNINTEKTTEGNLFIQFDKKVSEAACSESIDYAEMEKHDQVALVPFKGQWSDVGSWNAVAQLTEADANQNRIKGQGIARKTENTFIHAPNRPVVVLGVSDLLIIDTADAVLIAHQESSQDVKDVLSQFDVQGMDERPIPIGAWPGPGGGMTLLREETGFRLNASALSPRQA